MAVCHWKWSIPSGTSCVESCAMELCVLVCLCLLRQKPFTFTQNSICQKPFRPEPFTAHTLYSTAFTAETRTHPTGFFTTKTFYTNIVCVCDRPPHNRTTPAWSGAGAPLKQEKRLSPPEHTQACQLNASKSVTPFHTKKLLHRRAFAPEAVHTTRNPYKSLQEDDLDVIETWPGHGQEHDTHDQDMTTAWPKHCMYPDRDRSMTWPGHDRHMAEPWLRPTTSSKARPPCSYQGKRSKRSITSRKSTP